MSDKTTLVGLLAKGPTSKEDFVYETLKEAILSGRLKPGDSLVQTEIAKQLGVSHIPIRAAIQRLAVEELVEVELHHSPKVSKLTTEDLYEALLVRMHLEALAAREAFPHVDAKRLEQLWRMVEDMEAALEAEQFHEYGTLNKAFHLALYDACPYPLLKRMITDLWNNTGRHRSRAIFAIAPHLARQSQADHVALLKLIETREFDQASALLEAHKERARQAFLNASTEATDEQAVANQDEI